MVLLRKNLSFLNKSQKGLRKKVCKACPFFSLQLKIMADFIKKIYFRQKITCLFARKKE